MDENFNPNRAGDGTISDSVGKSSNISNSNCRAVADADVPLSELLGALEDGRVAITEDIVAIRAGPETYHPIKALKVMTTISRSSRRLPVENRWCIPQPLFVCLPRSCSLYSSM